MKSINSLKRQLKRQYLRWCRESDGYDCGMAIARHINPRISDAERKMAAIKKQVTELGEAVPMLPGESA